MTPGPSMNWQYRTLAQVSFIGTCDGAQIVNVFHFEAPLVKDGTLSTDVAKIAWSSDLVDNVITNVKAAYLAAHTTDYLLTMVRAQVLEANGTFRHKLSPVERPQTTGNAGTGISASNVNTTSVVLKWQTPQAGKSHRGRSYIGPIPATHALNGKLDPAAAGGLPYQALVDAFITKYGQVAGTEILNYVMTIYSKPYLYQEYGYAKGHNPNRTWYYPPDYPGQSTHVTNGSVDQTLRVQRRREVGVGG